MRKNVRSYEAGHPNPLFYRKDWMSLNGKWGFVFDDGNVGLSEGWSDHCPVDPQTINVPYAYETPSSGIDSRDVHNVLWYYRSFTNPRWGKRTLIHFERCDYVFDGWLNGHYLGRHVGGYDAFAYDITNELADGDNLLVVRVYDDKDPSHVRGKQTIDERPTGCFYTPTSGLYGDVWIEKVDPARLQGYDARASYQDKSVFFRLLFTPEAIGAQFIVDVRYRGKPVCACSLVVDNIYMEQELAIPKKEFHPWTPAHPALYDVTMSVVRNGEVHDAVLSYFGINEVTQKGTALALNGRKRFLKFVLYQGYNPKGGLTQDEKGCLKDITLIKAMGFNGVRVHEKVESELFYYLADREGLLTDVELPSPQSYDRVSFEEVSSEFGRLVRDHVGHPSIMAYVAFNESWGVSEIAHNPEVQSQARSLYDMANRIDWTRPAVANDGWESVTSDLLCLHNYAETGEELAAFYFGLKDHLASESNFAAAPERMAFAEGYHYSGQPYFLSEFFGAIFQSDARQGWGYAKPVANGKAYLRRYRTLLRAIKKLGFAGYCATQFADTYQEKNGFVNAKRVPKVSPDMIRRANQNF